jgi:hypothetical protein
MEWLDQNIDAYRIVSEILGQLRACVRRGLEEVYGEKWYRKGLPQDVFDRLVAAKEREKSIEWNDDQYQQIMGYSTFADLIEILQLNSEYFPEFISLAPSKSLLHARFLELDMMRAKMGDARPISETELSFLATFHLRFIKAVALSKDTVRTRADDDPESSGTEADPFQENADAAQEHATQTPDDGEVFVDVEVDAEDPIIESVPHPSPETEDDSPSPPVRQVQTSADSVFSGTGGSMPSLDDHESESGGEHTPSEDASAFSSIDEVDPQPVHDATIFEDSAHPDPVADSFNQMELGEALASDDHLTVLREIYREVTAIAEGVWNSQATPETRVWDQVISSNWYETNFSLLGLHPLSTFYEVTEKVNQKARLGASRSELQQFLSEANFAKTLLDLRDMFQANKI